MKRWVSVGPVSICFDVTLGFQFYSQGVYRRYIIMHNIILCIEDLAFHQIVHEHCFPLLFVHVALDR